MPLPSKMDVREYGKLFLRRKWLIVFTFLTILFVASVYCVVSPELYKSSITIIIIPQTVPQDYVRSTISFQVDQQIATISQQVMSRTALTTVMDELHLFEKERTKLTSEELFKKMRKQIGIEVLQGRGRGGMFSLSFLYEKPEEAMRGATRLASFFIDENLKTREQQAVGTSEFLESQLRDTKAKLEVMEKRVKDYKMRYMGELPQQLDTNLRMLTGLEERLRSVEAGIRSAEDRKASLETQFNLVGRTASTRTAGNGNPVLVFPSDPSRPLEAELAEKKAKLAELSVRYTDKVPEVWRAKQDVREIERRIEEARRTATALGAGSKNADHKAPEEELSSAGIDENRNQGPQWKAVTGEIASLKKEKEGLRKKIASAEQKISQSPMREQEMISLIRDYENQKNSYDDLLKKKLAADVSQNLEKRQKGTQFQILDPANLPQESFKPDRKKGMLIGLLLAFAAGFGGPVFRESLDLTLHDVRTFKHLYKAPILGTIPIVLGPESRRGQALRRAAVIGGLLTFTVALSVFLIAYHAKIRTLLNI